MGKVILTGKGRRWVLGGHPWIYRDDIAGGEAEPGELLPVEDPNGNPLGWGLFSASSKIAVRLVTSEASQPKRDFWAERVGRDLVEREAQTRGDRKAEQPREEPGFVESGRRREEREAAGELAV